MTPEITERTPREIESRIEEKRADLDRKLEELEQRLSPRQQFQRMKARIHPQPYIGWAAIGAVAAGTYLAVNGWRRAHRSMNGAAAPEAHQAAMGLEEVALLDCGSSE
jgi:hypothetical protein